MLRLAVVGHPVSHSRSPLMHTAALRADGIDGTYRAIDVLTPEGMRPIADAIRDGRLTGANITMPHKQTAYALSDDVTDDARLAGSVNTWFLEHGGLKGDTTDVAGVRASWSARALPVDGPILILGAGGAARAAVIALRGTRITVSARSEERVLTGAAGIYDMAYGSEETPAIRFARTQGIPFADGLDLLVAQAEASYRRWTGTSAPPGVMERAARNVSRGSAREPNQAPTPRQE
jgi:shikimate dehydrogenase